jgi:hypothetical protein
MTDGNPQTSTPRDADALREAMRALMALLNVAMPVKVVSYDATKQSATVQPIVRGRRRLADGTLEAYQLPPIANVPVMHPGGSNGAMVIPPAAGY